MVWDYSEPNPFGGGSGDARAALGLINEVIEHAASCSAGRPASVIRGRAQSLPLENDSIDAVITDPPYYDNVPYSDLSDFFYVWHRRAAAPSLPSLFTTSLTPKKAELIAERKRHDGDANAAAQFYESEMAVALGEACRVLKPEGVLIVVYAHKTTLGWSTLVESLRLSGFAITEAWPLDTEMPDRTGQMGNASLASSIFLVARKRSWSGAGDYAAVVKPEMSRIVEERVRDLMAVGVGGSDLVIAAVGAGLQPFTRFDRVELPNGEELPSARFLEEVQREVLECILAAVFSMDRSGVGQVDKASRFYVLGRYQHAGAPVEFGELNVLAQGVGVELSGNGSLSDGKGKLVDVQGSKASLVDYSKRGKNPHLGMPSNGVSAPLVDVLHRLAWLVENEPGATAAFLNDAQVDTERLRLLANALKGRALAGAKDDARTDEQKAVDRLLAQWKRIVESRALPLFATS